MRNSVSRNGRRQKHKRKIHCHQKKRSDGRSEQVNRDEAHMAMRRVPPTSTASSFYLSELSNFGRCKEAGSSSNACAAPFHIRGRGRLTATAAPAPPACLSGPRGRERTRAVAKADAGRDDEEARDPDDARCPAGRRVRCGPSAISVCCSNDFG